MRRLGEPQDADAAEAASTTSWEGDVLQLALDAGRMIAWQWVPASGQLKFHVRAQNPAWRGLADVDSLASLLARVAEGERDGLREALREAAEAGRDFAAELDFERAPGEWRRIRCSGRLRRGEGDDPAVVIGVAADITPRMVAEERMRQSEERFRLAALAANDAIWSWNLAEDALTWNEQIAVLFGHEDALAGSTGGWWLDRVHPDDRARVEGSLREALAFGDRWTQEYRFERADGAFAYVHDRGYVVRDERGRAIRMVGALADVTKRRQAEANFRRIFDSNILGILFADSAGRIVEANDAVLSLLKRRREELRTTRITWQELSAPECAEDDARAVESMMTTGRCTPYEKEYLRPDGTRVPVLVGAAMVEETKLSVAFVMDLSERRRIDGERERHARQLDRSLRFAELFVGVLGHDLRSPLTSIGLSLRALVREDDRARRETIVSRIERSLGRIDGMIDQLLDLTAIRLGQGLLVVPKPTDLGRLARLIVEEIDGAAAQLRLTVTGRVEGSWDGDRVAQALANLVRNAVQHGQPGEPVLVEVDGASPDQVELRVHNHGAMPDEARRTMFDPFRAPRPRRKDGSSGLGLGLFIAHEIARASRGDIRVESAPATGTTVTLRLPR